MEHEYDVAIVGGGIVGLATAMSLSETRRARLVVLEAEKEIASHQTGHNSGVIHSGLYYQPGSLKATNCAEGRERLYRFCEEHGVPHERCGKVVVASKDSQRPALDELERRGKANGLEGLIRLSPAEIRRYEPHAAGVDGLFVPQTGIVDFREVAARFADRVRENGGEIRTGQRLLAVTGRDGGFALRTTQGEARCRYLINCAGLHADRVARRCGVEPGLRIVPFRGEYYELRKEARRLVRSLIYPVPDPRFPFLGVHFTRRIQGGVEAGPNAILAMKREGYRWSAFSLRDMLEMLTYAGFWRMVRRYGRTGVDEIWRSLSRTRFVRDLKVLVPELRETDVTPGGAGVRAQAVLPDGSLADDFRIVEADRMIHVLNAPSPAATASLAIGRRLAEMAGKDFGLK